MKARYVEQGASRYVVGKATPFDQKNEMFCRMFAAMANKDTRIACGENNLGRNFRSLRR